MYQAKTILVINKCTVLPDATIGKYIVAVQRQISDHFGPIWGIYGNLKLVKEEDIKHYPNAWRIYFVDTPPKSDEDMTGVLGYHEFLNDGTPVGYVFAKTDIDNNLVPSVTFSHEVLEMLADAFTTWCALVNDTLYSIEVCDAVEADDDGYMIGDVRVSNFVYPEWFDPRCAGKKLDYMNQLKKPLEIRPGGYMSVFTIGKDSEWRNIDGGRARRMEVKMQTRPNLTRRFLRNNHLHVGV